MQGLHVDSRFMSSLSIVHLDTLPCFGSLRLFFPVCGTLAITLCSITRLDDSNGGIRDFHSFLVYFFS